MGPRRPRSPRLPSRLRRCLPSGKPPLPPLLSHLRNRLHRRRFHQPSRSLEGVPPRCLPPRSRSRPRRSSLHPRQSPQRVPPSRSIGQRPCKETDPDRNPAENGTGGAAARPRCRPCRRQPFAVDLIAGGRPFGQVAVALMTNRGGGVLRRQGRDTADSSTETPLMAPPDELSVLLERRPVDGQTRQVPRRAQKIAVSAAFSGAPAARGDVPRQVREDNGRPG